MHRTNYMGGENLPQPLGGATSELSERGGKLTRESSLGAKSLDSMRQAPRYAEKGSVPGRSETANVGIWHSCAPCSRGQPLRKSNVSEFCFAPAFLTIDLQNVAALGTLPVLLPALGMLNAESRDLRPPRHEDQPCVLRPSLAPATCSGSPDLCSDGSSRTALKPRKVSH